MSGRITEKFAGLHEKAKKGFIAYLTVGTPSLEATLEIALALEEVGVDILELGIPFSDPLADGAIIQAAAGKALAAGTTVSKVLELMCQLRKHSKIPVVLFTYLNPIYTYGFHQFHKDAIAAGADGLLVLDLTPNEAKQNAELGPTLGLDTIQLIAPTTPSERMSNIVKSAQGFIYYVSREGVTGEQSSLSNSIACQVAEIRKYTSLPIAVGFGISNPEQAAAVARSADAVVVGSAIVRHIIEAESSKNIAKSTRDFVQPLVEAIKSV